MQIVPAWSMSDGDFIKGVRSKRQIVLRMPLFLVGGMERRGPLPFVPVKKQRIGVMAGRGIGICPEFWDPLPEDELRLWNGEGE
jgi:hypothetical protein